MISRPTGLLSARNISDFEVGRDQVVRRGDQTFVIDTTGLRAETEVASDVMTPEFEANIAKLRPEQRVRMTQEVRSSPYLSEEGRAERLAILEAAPEAAGGAGLSEAEQELQHLGVPPMGGGNPVQRFKEAIEQARKLTKEQAVLRKEELRKRAAGVGAALRGEGSFQQRLQQAR